MKQGNNKEIGLATAMASMITRYRSLLLYGVIGGGAVLIDVSLFWLIDNTTSLNIALNNALSIFVAMVYSFLMNARFNFKTTDNLLPRFISFASVTTVGFVISTALLWILLAMHVPSVVAKVLTLPVVFIVQFMLNSRLTFRTAKEDIALESIS